MLNLCFVLVVYAIAVYAAAANVIVVVTTAAAVCGRVAVIEVEIIMHDTSLDK